MTDNLDEVQSIEEHVKKILREVQKDSEFVELVRNFNPEQPTYLDRVTAAVYLWGAHLQIRKAVEVMLGRRFPEDNVLLGRYVDSIIIRVWNKPASLEQALESLYDLRKK